MSVELSDCRFYTGNTHQLDGVFPTFLHFLTGRVTKKLGNIIFVRAKAKDPKLLTTESNTKKIERKEKKRKPTLSFIVTHFSLSISLLLFNYLDFFAMNTDKPYFNGLTTSFILFCQSNYSYFRQGRKLICILFRKWTLTVTTKCAQRKDEMRRQTLRPDKCAQETFNVTNAEEKIVKKKRQFQRKEDKRKKDSRKRFPNP